ncbi:MAG: hypothetical protein ABSG51_08415 [Terracidiphilus sp.]
MIHIYRSSLAQFSLVFLAAASGALYLLPKAQAQAPDMSTVNDQTQTPIPGVGHDYQHLLGETVNYSNGSVNFKISFPVATKSRGITLPYSWSYNSAGVNPLNMIDGNQPAWDDKAIQSGPEADGWNIYGGIPYAAVSVWSYSAPSNQHVTFAACNVQSGMTFTDSSGTTHNLYTAAEATGSNASGLAQTGGTRNYVPGNGDGQVIAKPDPNTAVNDLQGSSPVSGSFMVMDKNGTVYSFSGGVGTSSPSSLVFPSIEDRNGNFITMFPGGGNTLYTDSAGRPGPTVTSTSVTIDQLVFTPSWGTVNVNYTIAVGGTGDQAAGIGCVGMIPTTVSGTRGVLNSLSLPNGESYQSRYNNVYGLLSKIIYPDGGWIEYTWQLPTGSNNTQFNEIAFREGNETSAPYLPQPFGCSQLYQTPVLASRTVSFDGITTAQTQTFASPVTNWASSSGEISGWSTKSTTAPTTDAKTGQVSTTVYNYIPWGVPSQPYAGLIVAPSFPIESEIDYYDWGQSPQTNSKPTKTVNKTWYDQFNLASETTTIWKTSQVSETKYTYETGVGSNPTPSNTTFVIGVRFNSGLILPSPFISWLYSEFMVSTI